MFKIEKNVPIVESNVKSKYPFADMEVGDSFGFNLRQVQTVNSGVHRFYKTSHTGARFTIRKTSDGARCWRIK